MSRDRQHEMLTHYSEKVYNILTIDIRNTNIEFTDVQHTILRHDYAQ